jgi:hypothetical protein
MIIEIAPITPPLALAHNAFETKGWSGTNKKPTSCKRKIIDKTADKYLHEPG